MKISKNTKKSKNLPAIFKTHSFENTRTK